MIVGPLITAAMALMVVVAQSFTELLVYRFLAGWAAQMWLLARLARISHRAGANQRGRQVSWMYGMDNVGRLSGPLVGGLIATAFGERAPFVAYAFLALMALVPTIKLAEEVPTRRTTTKGESAPRAMSIPEIVIPRLPYFGVVYFSAMARGPIFAGMVFLYATYAYGLEAAGIGLLATTASVLGLRSGSWPAG